MRYVDGGYIKRDVECLLYPAHWCLQNGKFEEFYKIIKNDPRIIEKFDLWIAVESITLLYQQHKEHEKLQKDNTSVDNALVALKLLINSQEFRGISGSVWSKFHLNYYELRKDLPIVRSALLNYSPNNPHLVKLRGFAWRWHDDDHQHMTTELQLSHSSVIKRPYCGRMFGLVSEKPDTSLEPIENRLQDYMAVRSQDERDYWGVLYKPRQSKQKKTKLDAAQALQLAITQFKKSETTCDDDNRYQYVYCDRDRFNETDYKALYDALNNGGLHKVMGNSLINVDYSNDGLTFTLSSTNDLELSELRTVH